MNDTIEDNPIDQAMKTLIDQAFCGMDQVMTILINEAMKIERAGTLQAAAYDRTPDRQEHANGDKPKHVKSRPGRLSLSVPQVRADVNVH